MISGVSRRDGPGEIAEIDLKVALNMGSKMSRQKFSVPQKRDPPKIV